MYRAPPAVAVILANQIKFVNSFLDIFRHESSPLFHLPAQLSSNPPSASRAGPKRGHERVQAGRMAMEASGSLRRNLASLHGHSRVSGGLISEY